MTEQSMRKVTSTYAEEVEAEGALLLRFAEVIAERVRGEARTCDRCVTRAWEEMSLAADAADHPSGDDPGDDERDQQFSALDEVFRAYAAARPVLRAKTWCAACRERYLDEHPAGYQDPRVPRRESRVRRWCRGS